MGRLPTPLQISRPDAFRIRPHELLIDESYNGRCIPVSDEAIHAMALSLIKHGQQQPILIRRSHGSGDDAKYALVAGYTRTKAALLIRADAELHAMAQDAGRLTQDGIFPLSCCVVQGNAEDAWLCNVVENAHRNSTSPIDDAHNQDRLRQKGWSDREIAELYHVSAARIGQMKGLLCLEDTHRLMVHRGEMSVAAALALLNVAPEERQEILESVESPRRVSARVKKVQREQNIAVKRSMGEVRRFFKEESDGPDDDVFTDACRVLMGYLDGQLDEGMFVHEMRKLLHDSYGTDAENNENGLAHCISENIAAIHEEFA